MTRGVRVKSVGERSGRSGGQFGGGMELTGLLRGGGAFVSDFLPLGIVVVMFYVLGVSEDVQV